MKSAVTRHPLQSRNNFNVFVQHIDARKQYGVIETHDQEHFGHEFNNFRTSVGILSEARNHYKLFNSTLRSVNTTGLCLCTRLHKIFIGIILSITMHGNICNFKTVDNMIECLCLIHKVAV